MSIHEVPAEELARFLYRYHQSLAPYLGCKNASHAEPWTDVAETERRQLVTAAKLALMELRAEDHDKDNLDPEEEQRQRYFAEPGNAEWGC